MVKIGCGSCGGDVITYSRGGGGGGDTVVIYGSDRVVVSPFVSSLFILVFTGGGGEVPVVECFSGDVLGLDNLLLLPLG